VTAGNMKTLSLGEIRALKDAGKLRPTRPDAPEFDLPDDFWTRATLVERENRKSVHLRLDPEVYRFFKEDGDGRGHIKKMQQVLASYVRAQKAQPR